MPSYTTPLLTLLGLLALDAVMEVAFISSMVSYLHIAHHDVPFTITIATATGPSFPLFPKPGHPLVNQGHTSNGAAGTAFVLIATAGFLLLWWERRRGSAHTLRLIWTVFTVLSALLSLAALIYTFVVTAQTAHQSIDPSVAAAHPDLPYPVDEWTPENWYKAVLALPFADPGEKGDIRTHVRLMEGWRWNLIPLFLLGVAVAGVAVLRVLGERRGGRGVRMEREGKAVDS